MGLRDVVVTAATHAAGLTHALALEREEVMGLLLGDSEPLPDGDWRVYIWATVVLPRSEHKTDRVEIDPEALANAADRAEEVSERLARRTRVIGWYHSHPHLTPTPSVVDLRTQAQFQALDPAWVGLIFSAFNTPVGSHVQNLQLHAFQSRQASETAPHPGGVESDASTSSSSASAEACVGSEWVHVPIPILLVPEEALLGAAHVASAIGNPHHEVIQLVHLLRLEERDLYESHSRDAPVAQQLYYAGVYQQAIAKVLTAAVLPLRHVVAAQRATLAMRLRQLQHEEAELRRQLEAPPARPT